MWSIVILVSIFAVGFGLPVRFQGKFKNGLLEHVEGGIGADLGGEYFTQKLDHFDRLSTTNFQQRYFVNETFWSGSESKAPVFMCVGGEGPPFDAGVVQIGGSVHCDDMMTLASELGALVFALEHRYYGPSHPNPGEKDAFSTENLRFLNTEQAQEDLAAFVHLMNGKYNLNQDNKWVTWGGSYPGMMAGLARLRFPHLIHASVSSSSPLEASLEMPGYNIVVAESISNPDVGGSQACLDIVTNGHVTIKGMLETKEGRDALAAQFNLCDADGLEKTENQEQFAGDGVVYLPAQGNDPSCTGSLCNIDKICTFLTDPVYTAPIDALAALSQRQNLNQCVSVNYELFVRIMSEPSNPIRSWIWQTCTEWGFYMTCPSGSLCPYVKDLHKVNTDLDICQQAFGLSPEVVEGWIDATNSLYGGSNIQGSRIMFPNGEIDPWRANGVMVSPNAQEPTLYVLGASHHFWTHPAESTDSQAVKDARQAIWAQVTEWLNE
jgi:thymus-specific serine protease